MPARHTKMISLKLKVGLFVTNNQDGITVRYNTVPPLSPSLNPYKDLQIIINHVLLLNRPVDTVHGAFQSILFPMPIQLMCRMKKMHITTQPRY